MDNVSYSQYRDDEHGDFFRKIAEQGHYRGRVKPTNTRQGLYTSTASGQLLVSVNSNSVGRIQRLLNDAKRIWEKTTPAERSPKIKSNIQIDERFKRELPTDGLVLRTTMRDLPRDNPRQTDLSVMNSDHVWFTRTEMLSLVPEDLTVGKKLAMPDYLSSRMARLHLLDSVRGESDAYRPSHIQLADIQLVTATVTDEKIKFKISGHCRANRKPNKRINPFNGNAVTVDSGYDLILYGIAEFDRSSQRFSRFDLLAAGDRWGGTTYNFRFDDLRRSPIGFAFQLVPNAAQEPTPPRFYAYY